MNEKMIIAKLDSFLHQLGFIRRKAVWNRLSDHLVQVIGVQESKGGDKLTLNTGVLDPEVYRSLWGVSPPAIVDDARCTVQARIGELIDGKDIWWRIDDPQTAIQLAEETARHVLPFLERMRTRRAMLDWLNEKEVMQKRYPQPIINVAILTHLLGERVEARILLEKLAEKPIGAWRQRTAEVLTRLG